MSLFDNDFINTIVTEGKDCDKDCKKGKEVEDEKAEEMEDEDVDVDEELSDDDKEKAEEAAEFDVEEAASIEEMKGVSAPVAESAFDTHCACLEFLGTTAALDKADVACTESYVSASTVAEREAVTEGFKETVAKYYQKFKAFVLKIKNIIVRLYNRIKNYIVNFFTKVAKKVAMWKVTKLDTEKLNKSEDKIEVYSKVTGPLSDIVGEDPKTVKAGMNEMVKLVTNITSKSSDEALAQARSAAEDTKKMDKESIRKEMLGIRQEVSVKTFSNALEDLKKMKVPASLEKNRNQILKTINTIEGKVKSDKGLDSKSMAVRVTVINALVTLLNKMWAVLGTAVHHWVAPRVSIVARFGDRKFFGDEKKKGGKKKEATGESFNLVDAFEAL